jgi:hypothetical protein
MHKVGIDLGKSSVKFTCNGSLILEFPPLLAKSSMTGPFVDPGRGTLEVGLDGASWLVGESATAGLASRWITDEHKTGKDMLVMVLAALGQMGLQGQVTLCTGVPAALWRSDGASLGDLLSGEHRYTVNKRSRTVNLDVMVLPEPMGSFFSCVLGPDGRVADRQLVSESVAVVDIGYRTVDIMLVHQGRIAEDVIRSSGHGLATAFERVYALLASSVGILSDGERAEVFLSLIRATPLRLKGNVVKDGLYQKLLEERPRVAEQISADIRSALAGAEYRTLLMTGGGAEWLRDQLEPQFPGARWVDEPRLANARGFYRYAVLQAAQRRAGG